VFFFHVVILGSSRLMRWSPVDIFGVPLNESVLRAPATAILGGYRHDLPLVVFPFSSHNRCSHIGIYKSGLFRDLPNRQRHHELSTLFDTSPAYLKELPEPVLTPYLFNAFWNWSASSRRVRDPRGPRAVSCMKKHVCVQHRTRRLRRDR